MLTSGAGSSKAGCKLGTEMVTRMSSVTSGTFDRLVKNDSYGFYPSYLSLIETSSLLTKAKRLQFAWRQDSVAPGRFLPLDFR
jgi:glycerate-2-kinase